MVLAVPFSNPGGYGYTAQYPCDNKGTDRARHAVQKLCTVAALSQGAKQQLDGVRARQHVAAKRVPERGGPSVRGDVGILGTVRYCRSGACRAVFWRSAYLTFALTLARAIGVCRRRVVDAETSLWRRDGAPLVATTERRVRS